MGELTARCTKKKSIALNQWQPNDIVMFYVNPRDRLEAYRLRDSETPILFVDRDYESVLRDPTGVETVSFGTIVQLQEHVVVCVANANAVGFGFGFGFGFGALKLFRPSELMRLCGTIRLVAAIHTRSERLARSSSQRLSSCSKASRPHRPSNNTNSAHTTHRIALSIHT
jgi:hypothetical protein